MNGDDIRPVDLTEGEKAWLDDGASPDPCPDPDEENEFGSYDEFGEDLFEPGERQEEINGTS